jgi:PPM family protein phosphatase
MSATQTEAIASAPPDRERRGEKDQPTGQERPFRNPSSRASPSRPVIKPDLVVSACTAQHRGDRREQQDRVLLLSSTAVAAPAPLHGALRSLASSTKPTERRHALAVLADGLGGMSGGSLASENVMLLAQRRFPEFVPGEQSERHFFEELVDETHTVISIAAMTSELEPHTTFTGLMVQQHRVDWCHVGDSRIYHFREGHLMSVTEDHTLAWQLVQEGKSLEKAAMHPQAHKLVNTLGGSTPPIPAFGFVENPVAGDSFLLCSDGLWSYFDPMELGTIIVSFPAGQAANRLISLARERAEGKGDNVSLALIKFDNPEGQIEATLPDLTVNSRWL